MNIVIIHKKHLTMKRYLEQLTEDLRNAHRLAPVQKPQDEMSEDELPF